VSKLFASHLVTLEGKDDLMATLPGFEQSHTVKGLCHATCLSTTSGNWSRTADSKSHSVLATVRLHRGVMTLSDIAAEWSS
jgi:hypothetical protein